jgi:hypothetical protein
VHGWQLVLAKYLPGAQHTTPYPTAPRQRAAFLSRKRSFRSPTSVCDGRISTTHCEGAADQNSSVNQGAAGGGSGQFRASHQKLSRPRQTGVQDAPLPVFPVPKPPRFSRSGFSPGRTAPDFKPSTNSWWSGGSAFQSGKDCTCAELSPHSGVRSLSGRSQERANHHPGPLGMSPTPGAADEAYLCAAEGSGTQPAPSASRKPHRASKCRQHGRCCRPMWDLCKLIWWAFIGLFRLRVALVAENLALRQQINVLRRTAPKRPRFCSIDIRRPVSGVVYRSRRTGDRPASHRDPLAPSGV